MLTFVIVLFGAWLLGGVALNVRAHVAEALRDGNNVAVAVAGLAGVVAARPVKWVLVLLAGVVPGGAAWPWPEPPGSPLPEAPLPEAPSPDPTG